MPAAARHLRGEHLAPHAAAPELGADPDLGLAGELALGDQLGARGAGRARVDALDLGEEDEQPRPDEHRDLRRERVVVAERDLVGRRRVVLVHDGHRAEPEELGERLARVHVRGAVGDVARGEQDLGGGDARARRARPPRRPAAAPGRAPRPPGAGPSTAGRRSRPSFGSPSAIAPDETTQTGSPPPTSVRDLSRARV